jgi:hypothetical protein
VVRSVHLDLNVPEYVHYEVHLLEIVPPVKVMLDEKELVEKMRKELD